MAKRGSTLGPKPTPRDIVRNQEEIDTLSVAIAAREGRPTAFRGMSYAEGVAETIRWLYNLNANVVEGDEHPYPVAHVVVSTPTPALPPVRSLEDVARVMGETDGAIMIGKKYDGTYEHGIADVLRWLYNKNADAPAL